MPAPDENPAAQSQPEHADIDHRHHFFEFPPEIRNQIYTYLFQNQKIIIRDSDFRIVHKDGQLVSFPNFKRDRSLGLNLLLASKCIFAEAKPILMATGFFDLDHLTILHRGLRHTFREAEMQMIRSLNVDTRSFVALRAVTSLMTSLSNVVLFHDSLQWEPIYNAKRKLATSSPKDARALPGIDQLVSIWKILIEIVFKGFEQNAARRGEVDCLSFVIKMRERHMDMANSPNHLTLMDVSVIELEEADFCYELVSGTAWMEDNGSLMTPKVKVRGLTAYLDMRAGLGK